MKEIILEQCRACGRVRKLAIWVFMTHYERLVLIHNFKVKWVRRLCDDCYKEMANGKTQKAV